MHNGHGPDEHESIFFAISPNFQFLLVEGQNLTFSSSLRNGKIITYSFFLKLTREQQWLISFLYMCKRIAIVKIEMSISSLELKLKVVILEACSDIFKRVCRLIRNYSYIILSTPLLKISVIFTC